MRLTPILQYGFYHIKDGALHSWQWLHITIALVSLISASEPPSIHLLFHSFYKC